MHVWCPVKDILARSRLRRSPPQQQHLGRRGCVVRQEAAHTLIWTGHPEAWHSNTYILYRDEQNPSVKGLVPVLFWNFHHRGERGRNGRRVQISKQSTQNLWPKDFAHPCMHFLKHSVPFDFLLKGFLWAILSLISSMCELNNEMIHQHSLTLHHWF